MAAAGEIYGDGTVATTAGGANQLAPYYYERKALIDKRREAYFGQLASVKAMPKNHGKQIKQYHIIPLVDDRNINDQGLDATGATIANGNLYGSSRDIGYIPSKIPTLTETGGRVNRVGFTRKEIVGTMENLGFFWEYSEDLMNFDSDEEVVETYNRELLNGAMEVTEAALQLDLLNSAGLVRYAGIATSNATIDATCVVTYHDLMRLSIDLDHNRTPKQTTIITGTRLIDTMTLNACRVMYIGSELIPTIEALVDSHGNPAWIPVRKYAADTTLLNGERGSVGEFRVVVVPLMQNWSGQGATATDPTFYATGGKYDVYPMLVVGDESFTTIGFQTDGKSMKFKIINKKPSQDNANQLDPYGKKGFTSINWWYGFMALRPERIGLIKTAAKM